MKFREVPKIKSLALGALLAFTPFQTGEKVNFANSEIPQPDAKQQRKIIEQKDDTFIYFGKDKNPDYSKIEFIGISHPLYTDSSKSGFAYLDPALISKFFQELKNAGINPQNVVLIVEDKVPQENQFIIRDNDNMFITIEMKNLGFRKWVPADSRPNYSVSDAEKVRESGIKLAELMQKYLKTTNTGKLDEHDLPILSFELDQKISKGDLDVIKDCLRITVIPSMVFEKNLVNLHDSLKKQGYKPIVLAGRQHILATRNSSLLQAEKSKNESEKQAVMQKLNDELNFIAGSRHLAKELLGYE